MVVFSCKNCLFPYHTCMLFKIYKHSADQAYEDIMQKMTQNWSCIVSFLYFANAMKRMLFEDIDWSDEFVAQAQTYMTSLEAADYVLPDGIALQTFSRISQWDSLSNLNGTDFIPFFIKKAWKEVSLSVYLYQCYDPSLGKHEDSLNIAKDALMSEFDVSVPRASQCLYTQRGEAFDRDWLDKALVADGADIKVFLNCTWTPFQENWTHANQDFFRKHGCLVFNAWGLIDYLTWFEQRAPTWVIKARVLETLRRIVTKPKKNLHKFLSMFGIIRFFWKPLRVK